LLKKALGGAIGAWMIVGSARADGGTLGMAATGKTTKPVVEERPHRFRTALESATIRAKLFQLQLAPAGHCGEAFAAFLRAQDAEMHPVVQGAGLKLY
jgi:tripartite-type tricarboxylate transporter receptor subunit TctC